MDVDGSQVSIEEQVQRVGHGAPVRCSGVGPAIAPEDRLSKACAAVLAAEDLAAVVAAVVTESLTLLEARWAHLEVDARDGAAAMQHTASAPRRARIGDHVRVVSRTLFDETGASLGALVLGAPSLEPEAEARLSGFVRVASRALGNALRWRAADAALRAREEALTLASHDLRSALCTMALGAGMIRRRAAGRGPAGAPDTAVATRMERSCREARRLLDDLLDVSRLDAGRFSVTPVPLPSTSLLADALDAVSLLATAANVSLRGQPGDSRWVMADAHAIARVFANLLGNALKFTPGGGTISLSVEACEGFARFRVTDTGPGIPRAHLARIFDRYWQGEGEARGGHGLGLYIARSVVQAHGGELRAENNAGPGSTFSFTLPLATPGVQGAIP